MKDYKINNFLGKGVSSLTLGAKNLDNTTVAIKVNYGSENESEKILAESIRENRFHELLTTTKYGFTPIEFGVPKSIDFIEQRGYLKELSNLVPEEFKDEYGIKNGFYNGLVVVEYVPNVEKLTRRVNPSNEFFDELKTLINKIHDHGLSIPGPRYNTLRVSRGKPYFLNWKSAERLDSLDLEKRIKLIEEQLTLVEDLRKSYIVK